MTTHINKIHSLLSDMSSISLDQMDTVKLMRRVDSKFVLPFGKLYEVLKCLKNEYKVLEIKNEKWHKYSTQYYDTIDLDMYHMHHNGRLNRYKVRQRCYNTSNANFLEVKFKNNKRETIKNRISTDNIESLNNRECNSFLKKFSPYLSNDIKPVLNNTFTRVTLVHKHIPERVTIDFNLNFVPHKSTESVELPGIGIIEVKRDFYEKKSTMISTLKSLKIKETGFSKYCIGTAMLNQNARTNLFKSKIRNINKINNGNLAF